ncbi:hypothetical protein Vretimale_14818 [Volvox reticuliferus]|nr:hypothetical protein Vretifemale_19288 [Volvox reticuliferus]GIM11293.1 hypothetical protein Vretimale_14818 [Volvox reticuliferus]
MQHSATNNMNIALVDWAKEVPELGSKFLVKHDSVMREWEFEKQTFQQARGRLQQGKNPAQTDDEDGTDGVENTDGGVQDPDEGAGPSRGRRMHADIEQLDMDAFLMRQEIALASRLPYQDATDSSVPLPQGRVHRRAAF